MSQLEIFAEPEPEREWTSGWRPDRSGAHAYTAMIRGPHDPERRPRPVGGQEMSDPHRWIQATPPEEWQAPILEALEEHGPLTMNGIGIMICDKSGDIVGLTNFEEALWQLAEAGRLEFTTHAPIYWRRREDT